ncbi:hypothetical protein KVR01_010561 [Diaporthe batatas]|uniref:uncharacterized protein n=1 Tax=Diaporthe batatas TaxID=748121 RepID=UPI001D044E13|nr:uncharacterized protein KVR01_010561 [Diaporthe batatas]KAG8159924.1 hypothetical protein KVR01_010561 [Diaporthe batatas]
MKLSLATPTVLLCATAGQALLIHHPVGGGRVLETTESGPLKARDESSGTLLVPTTGGIENQVSALIQAAQDPEDKEKILKDLEASRKDITENLLKAQVELQKAESKLATELDKYEDAKDNTKRVKGDLDGLEKEKVELESRVNATKVKLRKAKGSLFILSINHKEALDARKKADDEVKELREAIKNVDEAIGNIGDPKN